MPDYKQFKLPDTAEGLTDAEILGWHVKPGDDVVVNQIIVEIETAKAAVELPCPSTGRVTDVLAASGPSGVITRDDVQRAVAPVTATPSRGERERRVPVKGVRKATAQAMVSSAFTAPHVTEFLAVDVTPMMELRAKLKNDPKFAGIKLTPLTFAAKAVCLAVRRTPDVNAVWAGDEIVYKSYVHLGIAAATPRG